MDAGEVCREEFSADGFEHLDADDLVVRTARRHGQGAIVAQQDFDVLGQAGVGYSTVGEFFLFLGQGQGGDSAAGALDGADSETAPAGADFEDVVGSFYVRVVDEAVEFAVLCFFEGFFLFGLGAGSDFGERPPYGAGVGHVFGEESAEHVVADIVVCADVQEGVGQSVGFAQEPTDCGRYSRRECRAVAEMLAVQNEDLLGQSSHALSSNQPTLKNEVRSEHFTSPSI